MRIDSRTADLGAQESPLLTHVRERFGEGFVEAIYVDDATTDGPASHARVLLPGGHALDAALWLPLQSTSEATCLNLLHLLTATEAPSKDMLQVRRGGLRA